MECYTSFCHVLYHFFINVKTILYCVLLWICIFCFCCFIFVSEANAHSHTIGKIHVCTWLLWNTCPLPSPKWDFFSKPSHVSSTCLKWNKIYCTHILHGPIIFHYWNVHSIVHQRVINIFTVYFQSLCDEERFFGGWST